MKTIEAYHQTPQQSQEAREGSKKIQFGRAMAAAATATALIVPAYAQAVRPTRIPESGMHPEPTLPLRDESGKSIGSVKYETSGSMSYPYFSANVIVEAPKTYESFFLRQVQSTLVEKRNGQKCFKINVRETDDATVYKTSKTSKVILLGLYEKEFDVGDRILGHTFFYNIIATRYGKPVPGNLFKKTKDSYAESVLVEETDYISRFGRKFPECRK